MSVNKFSGKKAITNYKTLEIYQNKNVPKISLVECQLETGRTHQIRVHMSFKGNAILGDKVQDSEIVEANEILDDKVDDSKILWA